MMTDNGAHPPEVWAQVTAEHIAPISDDMVGPRRAAAQALQAKIAEALLPHHTAVQNDERGKLKSDPKHHANPLNSKAYIAAALKAITGAAKGTEWEGQLTLTKTKPLWLDKYVEDVEAKGGENVPLNAVQEFELKNWKRQCLIAQEIETHFNTVQQIEKSWHRDRMGAR